MIACVISSWTGHGLDLFVKNFIEARRKLKILLYTFDGDSDEVVWEVDDESDKRVLNWIVFLWLHLYV